MNPTHFIIHTIQLKPGSLDKVRALFEEKVPPLAQRFDAWCGARLTLDRDNDRILTVGAWADTKQMQAFLDQPAFGEAMAGFAEHFAAPPETRIVEVVTEVGPRS
jgi:quinol monooxygenase YgiN